MKIIRKAQLPKHVPERTCIGCRQVRLKRELVRLVHTSSGMVELDPSGKKAGRGVYLCSTQSCWEMGLKGNRLEYALRRKIAPENKTKLMDSLKEHYDG